MSVTVAPEVNTSFLIGAGRSEPKIAINIQSDITAYELAKLMGLNGEFTGTQASARLADPDISRHFRVIREKEPPE